MESQHVSACKSLQKGEGRSFENFYIIDVSRKDKICLFNVSITWPMGKNTITNMYVIITSLRSLASDWSEQKLLMTNQNLGAKNLKLFVPRILVENLIKKTNSKTFSILVLLIK